MKRIFTIYFCLLGFFSNAQERFTAAYNPCSLDAKVEPGVDYYCHNKIANKTTKPIELYWLKENVMVPFLWNSYICDANLCYSSFTTRCPEDSPNYVLVDSNMTLDVHFEHDNTQGSAHVVVWIYEKSDTVNRLKVDYLFNKVLSNQEVQNIYIKMYPNPATYGFMVDYNTGLKKVEIYSILGKKLKTYAAARHQSYDISGISDGVYLVKLLGNNDQIIKTLRLQKRTPRA